MTLEATGTEGGVATGPATLVVKDGVSAGTVYLRGGLEVIQSTEDWDAMVSEELDQLGGGELDTMTLGVDYLASEGSLVAVEDLQANLVIGVRLPDDTYTLDTLVRWVRVE